MAEQLSLFSKEADAAMKKKVAAAEAIADLFRQAMAGDPQQWMRDILAFMRDMRRYSVFTNKLVWMQRPGASAIGTAKYWRSRRRAIRPGAIPIVILVPNGPIMPVFEYEDTEGKAEPASFIEAPPRLDPLTDVAVAAFIARVEKAGSVDKKPGLFVVREESLGYALHGDVHYARDAQDRYVVRINRNKPPTERALTLAHELGHVMCGHVGAHKRGFWRDRRAELPTNPQARNDLVEFEAEAVAWIVATRAGLDSTAPDYLADRVTRLDRGAIDMNAVLDAANAIEALRPTGP